MDEWMWRKIIEKMYDPKDYEMLESRFITLIEEKKALTKSRHMGNSTNMTKFLMDSSMHA